MAAGNSISSSLVELSFCWAFCSLYISWLVIEPATGHISNWPRLQTDTIGVHQYLIVRYSWWYNSSLWHIWRLLIEPVLWWPPVDPSFNQVLALSHASFAGYCIWAWDAKSRFESGNNRQLYYDESRKTEVDICPHGLNTWVATGSSECVNKYQH